MGTCLSTKLKGTVNDDSLLTLTSFNIRISAGGAFTVTPKWNSTTSYTHVVAKAINGTAFKDGTTFKESVKNASGRYNRITLQAPTDAYVDVSLSSKYDMDTFEGVVFNTRVTLLSDLMYCSKIGGTFDILDINYKKTLFTATSFGYRNIRLVNLSWADFLTPVVFPNLTTFSTMAYSGLKYSDFSKLTSLTGLNICNGYSTPAGSIADMASGMVANGRESGTLTYKVYNVGGTVTQEYSIEFSPSYENGYNITTVS